MLFKRFIILSLMLSLSAVLVTGCGKKEAASTKTTDTANTQTQATSTPTPTNTTPAAKTIDLKVTAPAGWTQNANAVTPMYQMNTASFIITRDIVPGDAKTPDEYVELVKKMYAKSFNKAEFKPTQTITVAGNDARMLEYSCEISSMKMQFAVVYIIKNGSAYTLTLGDTTATFENTKKDLQSFLDSVKFE
jgi:hypothetical protein